MISLITCWMNFCSAVAPGQMLDGAVVEAKTTQETEEASVIVPTGARTTVVHRKHRKLYLIKTRNQDVCGYSVTTCVFVVAAVSREEYDTIVPGTWWGRWVERKRPFWNF